jgi:drug/metabolite transporter (DMT)-like permease
MTSPVIYSKPKFTILDLALVLTMTIWGTHFVVAKAAFDVLPPLTFNFIRFCIGMVAWGIATRVAGQPLTLPLSAWRHIIPSAVIFAAIYQPLLMTGLQGTTVANSVLISTAAPVWMVLFNAMRGAEQVGRRAVFGVLLALSGIVTVVFARYAGQVGVGSATIGGDLLSIAASLVWVGMVLFNQRMLTLYPIMTLNLWTFVGAAFIEFFFALPQMLHLDWSRVQPPVILALFYSGFVAVMGAGIIWNVALKRLGASRTAVYINLQPIIAAVVAILFLGEPLTGWLILGILLVLCGMWLVRRG